MDRLQQKCLIASASLHGLLLLILVVGVAFFAPARPPVKEFHRLKVVPRKLIDESLSGGGGNPKIAPTEQVQKGETLTPAPAPPVDKPTPTPPKKQEVAPPVSEDPPPKELEKVEPKKTPDPPAKTPPPTNKPKTSKPNRSVVKDTPRPVRPDSKSPKPAKEPPAPLDLKPVVRNETDWQQVEADRRAQEEKRQRRAQEERDYLEATRRSTAAGQKATQLLGQTIASLKEGFKSGTVIETSGRDGEAYAGYDQFVKEAYDNAWQVSPDLTDENSTTRVSVTIRNTGHVIDAKVINRSGNPALDRSVEKALRAVRFIAPFPEAAKDKQRTFIINFNLKAKRQLG